MKVPQPMMAVSAAVLPIGDRWSYEVKWDGYRTLAQKDGPRVQLWSRNLKEVTRQYPAVARAAATVHADSALIDGEIVALDENGRPSFQALHHQAARAVVFYAFDLLHLNGRDLTGATLDERRDLLTPVVGGTPLLHSEPLPGTPKQIERAVRQLRLEGVVAKRRDSRYEAGRRSDAWVKVKFSRRQEFVVGGYKPAGASFDSLLVGYYERRKLYYAGKVRAGLTPHLRAALFGRLRPLATARCPFVNLPSNRSSHWGEGVTVEDMETLCWVKPSFVVEIAFTEWTRDGNLRHASFVDVRDDKPASEVRRE
jgi:bifunctional non-homologous end joining protein LigD